MRVSEFDFDLPHELIAQTPRPRGQSRLLVVDRAAGRWREAAMADLPRLLDPGDLVVVNDTRVFPARLIGRRDPSGGAVECLLLEAAREDEAPGAAGDDVWHALVHPGQKLKAGARIVLDDPARAPGVSIRGQILARRFSGRRLVRLEAIGAPTLAAAVDAIGHVPLPPYIDRPDTPADRDRYQTTAGLHFTEAIVASLDAAGIGRAAVTLHVGYGTFKPVRADRVEDHRVDPERYEIPAATAEAIRRTHAARRRVVAVGTTTTRAIESAATGDHEVAAGPGIAALFIHPGHPGYPGDPGDPGDPGSGGGSGHRFQAVDALVTNFHLPRSSLLMLVCAFAGRDLVLAAYRDAIARGFQFYSYGDAMLIE
jgi:S-adenosylmethionine:tRNA ribosyltransferase-isomerase